MKSFKTKKLFLFSWLVAFLIFSCKQQKSDPLQSAIKKLEESNLISFTQVAYYPVEETGIVDTVRFELEFSTDPDNSLAYSFIAKRGKEDIIYQDSILQIVNHEDSMVSINLPSYFENHEEFKKKAEMYYHKKLFPLTLLHQKWDFKTDTVIENTILFNYSRIEREGEYEGKKARADYHIFINPETALLERFERRFYMDGKLTQCVVNKFLDFQLSKNTLTLNYPFPNDYLSVYGIEKNLVNLKEGQMAPPFSAVDIEGNEVKLEDFKGKKVLLNFSIITCSYCKMVLNHFNKEDFELTEKVKFLYINIEDGEERMKSYIEKTPIPFPVIASASEIGKAYGVNAFPSFFLIDEQGKIEEIHRGYSKEFIDRFRK